MKKSIVITDYVNGKYELIITDYYKLKRKLWKFPVSKKAADIVQIDADGLFLTMVDDCPDKELDKKVKDFLIDLEKESNRKEIRKQDFWKIKHINNFIKDSNIKPENVISINSHLRNDLGQEKTIVTLWYWG